MTGILNRLERVGAGYGSRVPDPADRRRVRGAAVPAAVTRVVALYQPHYARLTDLFADLFADELAAITDSFTPTTAMAHSNVEELRDRDTKGG
ncbi:DNA-binding MarR family transcriptional regulator [Streptomyces sp. LBL]|nr:DNA-binding MarR family transcriptional regulator [Streptomyces sp. LBL]